MMFAHGSFGLGEFEPVLEELLGCLERDPHDVGEVRASGRQVERRVDEQAAEPTPVGRGIGHTDKRLSD